MTKNELIEKVAKKASLTKRAAADAVNNTFNLVRDGLVKGEKVVIFTENSKTITVTIEKIKIFLEVAKKIIKKTKLKLQKT